MTIDLRLGDCLVEMPKIETASIDAIIADIPYGTTACKWDTVIPFAPMWEQLKRIAKPRAAIVLFGSQPFTSALVMSNAEWFRYEWVWEKEPSGNLNAKIMPMLAHEHVCVFSSNGHTYNPQGLKPTLRKRGASDNSRTQNYGKQKRQSYTQTITGYPCTLLAIAKDRDKIHPTQKPVALMEYLIRTYTNEGDTVLDFTMGSGTTMVACVNTGRNGIGIEKDEGYFAIAQRRIADAQKQPALVMP